MTKKDVIKKNFDDVETAQSTTAVENKNCKMQRVVVKEDLTNNGIGSRMMIFCEDVAKKNAETYDKR